MKKKYVVIFSVLIILSVVIYICKPKTKEEVEDKTKTNVNTNGFLTLMLEQDDGTYQKSTTNTWPTGNYAFNSTLSGCERGGELVFDRETNIVKLISSGSDKCYVYFDKYNVAKITNVTNTKTTNSVTLTVTTEAGENPIDKYYFSKDNGNSYVESTSQTYTFTELTPNTTYTFKVYAKDTLGYETNEESIQVTTNAYVNPTVNNITVTDTTTSSISISVSASGGTNNVATYYYSINNGEFTSSSSNTKTFTGLSKGTTYTIKVYVTDTNGVSSSVKTTSAETENTVLLADYIKGLYTSQGSNGIYYHTSSLANSAADNSYRYSGANPNNYVCFGSTASTCPSDNLYRIIGVFGSEVKLIKANILTNNQAGTNGAYYYSDTFYWNSNTSNNIWKESNLNIINLNTNFLNSFDKIWQDKVSTHTWKVGGMSYNNGTSTPKTAYNYEVGSSSSSTTDSMKVGLMYVSDYGFAASNNYWTTALIDYAKATSYNWLYMGLSEWTISRDSSSSSNVLVLSNDGAISYAMANFNRQSQCVRPCFYLTSSITYASGSGTSSDPIRIN